ncbi:hypothetical protein TNCV_1695871 [Trichonephila clavipes]|nr:hypothetical protein TNCV_1695871 [Trichonephila clavipes]
MPSSQHGWNEEEIGEERSKASYVLTNNEAGGVENWYYRYFSNYDRIIRLIAWILRFKDNCKNVTGKNHGELTVTEFQEAETKVLFMIQTESFLSEEKIEISTNI